MDNKEKITVAQYLIKELNKLGINDFFGLPGDYNFKILDAVIENPLTNWVGCTNELNAGYAADGYARMNGYGALVTTYGVGELSAVNAIAGSFAESVPVIKIVGVPASKFINNNTMLHHNFQNPDYRAFERVYSNVSAGTAYLFLDTGIESIKEEIDRILNLFIKEQKPVYLAIPMDVCSYETDAESGVVEAKSDENTLNEAVDHAMRLLNDADNPVILADVLIDRYKAKKEFEKFLFKSQYPVTTLLMGKGVVDEDYERFMGTYQGEYGNLQAYKRLAESDGVVSVGTVLTDINTMRFSLPFSPDGFIHIQGNYSVIENIRYENVRMKDMLDVLSERLCDIGHHGNDNVIISSGYEIPLAQEDKKLTAAYIFPKLQEFLRPNDVIFAETGIIPYATAPFKLPSGVSINYQLLWGSIGWATPAALGAAIATKSDESRRTVLITGEGSHQLTAAEVSTMMRNGLKPIIFVINNSGYTIERFLSKDPMDEFNDIAQWSYTKLPEVFSGDAFTAKIRTETEFDEVLEQLKTENETKLCYVELFTDMMDAAPLTNNVLKGIKLTETANL